MLCPPNLGTVALAFLLMAVQAAAQEWGQFGFRKLGFVFDVPLGFVLKETAENGRGATFEAEDGAFLTVWGGGLSERNFKTIVQTLLDADEDEGWDVTYRRVTPTWASYAGIKDGRIRYVRAIAVCNDRVGIFQLDYDIEDKVPYNRIVVRMVRSLKAEAC